MKLAEFKQGLFNQKSNKRNLFTNLKFAEIQDLRQIFRAYYKHPIFRLMVGKPDKPSNVEALVEVKTIGYTKSFIRELNWTIACCEQYKSDINLFLEKKNEYESLFLQGDFTGAEEILNNIFITHGVSIWWLENTLLLKEYKDGVKENWSQLSEFSKHISSPYVLFFLEKFSKRAEKNISYFRFKNLFNNIANELGIASVFNEYLCFKFSYSSFIGYTNFDYYLWLENQFPIIDRYLTMVDVLIEVNLHHTKNDTINFNEIINDLNNSFNDFRLKQLQNLNNQYIKNVQQKSYETMSVFDLYAEQNYLECLNTIPVLIRQDPLRIELYEVYVKSLIELNKPFRSVGLSELVDQILESLYNVYSRNENNEESVEWLLKIVQSFGSASWAKVLLGQLASKINLSNDVENYIGYSFINSEINNPRSIGNFIIGVDGYNSFKYTFPDSNSVIIQGYSWLYEESIPEVDKIKFHIYKGRRLFNSRKYDLACIQYEELIINKELTIPYYEEVVKNLYQCYVKTGRLIEAIRLYTNNFLANNYLVSSLEADNLIDEINRKDIDELGEDIGLPIFFNVVGAESYTQYVAYDSFLSYLGVERPTEIQNLDSYDKVSIIYFLKNVCKSEIMHYSLFFESSDDIESERIDICRILLGLDPENETEYYDEIAEVTQQSSIRNAIREVNKGKITININKLKSSEASNIKESFSRFRELASFSKNKDLVAIDSTSEILKNYLSNYENENELFDKVVFSHDPAFITFKVMFLEIRDKFILSKEYGLDGYLSTRIRHGTLKNHLRSLFESLNLITQKNAEGFYVENLYWSNRIQNEYLNEILQDSLRNFSKELDDLADYIIKELIQVKTEKYLDKSNALFDYSFSQDQLGSVFKHIRDANFKDYNEFLELITNLLVARTEEILTLIREILTNQIQSKFHLIITQLQNSIKLEDIDKLLPELSSAILKSNTDIQQELENVAAWFNLTEQSSNLILNIETIIKTAVEITNSIYPNNKIYPVIKDETDLYLSGQYCPQLIYINRILLDNIITHSGMGAEDLDVVISSNLDQTKETEEVYTTVLELSYTNNLHQDTDLKKLDEKLKHLAIKFNDPESKFENINFEGGSGLEKIKKILSIDLNVDDYGINFLVGNYSVEVKLSIRVTIKTVNDEKNQNSIN
jgi:hypothetical protein